MLAHEQQHLVTQARSHVGDMHEGRESERVTKGSPRRRPDGGPRLPLRRQAVVHHQVGAIAAAILSQHVGDVCEVELHIGAIHLRTQESRIQVPR